MIRKFLVSLVINALISGLMGELQQRFPETTIILLYIVNVVITTLVIGFLFAIIFKVLPDELKIPPHENIASITTPF